MPPLLSPVLLRFRNGRVDIHSLMRCEVATVRILLPTAHLRRMLLHDGYAALGHSAELYVHHVHAASALRHTALDAVRATGLRKRLCTILGRRCKGRSRIVKRIHRRVKGPHLPLRCNILWQTHQDLLLSEGPQAEYP